MDTSLDIEKTIVFKRSQDIHVINEDKIDIDPSEGILSYTGFVNKKLASDEYCRNPWRKDCNHSKCRKGYTGVPYKRCSYMKYDLQSKTWYCLCKPQK
jgi:hypothetical protein